MDKTQSHDIKVIVKNSDGVEKIITLQSNAHLELQPGEIITVDQNAQEVSALVPLFHDENLAVEYSDNSIIILEHFFTRVSEDSPMPGIHIGEGTYHAPDFIGGLVPSTHYNHLASSASLEGEGIAQTNQSSADFSKPGLVAAYDDNDHHAFIPHTDHGIGAMLRMPQNVVEPIAHYTPPSSYADHIPQVSTVNDSGIHNSLPIYDDYTHPIANDLFFNAYKTQVINVTNPDFGILHYDQCSKGEKIIINSNDAVSDLGVAIHINADGTFIYDPTNLQNIQALKDGQLVVDNFHYSIIDGHGNTDTATVSITLNGANDWLVLGTNGSDNTQLGKGVGDLVGGYGNNVIIGDPGGYNITQLHPVVNVCLVLDVSNNMKETIVKDFNSYIDHYITKLDLMKASVMELISKYEDLASKGAIVNINVVPFSDAQHTHLSETYTLTGKTTEDLHQLQSLIANLQPQSDSASYTEALYQAQQWLHGINDYTHSENSVIFMSDGIVKGVANPHYFFPDGQPLLEKNGEPLQFHYELGRGTWDDLMQNADIHVVGVGENTSFVDLGIIPTIDHFPYIITNTDNADKVYDFVPDPAMLAADILYGSDDVIYGGWGNNIIFSDVPNTDLLSSSHYGPAGAHDGSGYAVLSDHFNGDTQAIIDYLSDPTDFYGNARQLADTEHGANNTIHGGNGHNVIIGQGGNNHIYGGDAGDIIFTGNGNNIIHTGNGANYIDAGNGQNQIFGGMGDDTIVFHEGNLQLGTGLIDGGGGHNTLLFTEHDQLLDLTQAHNSLLNFDHIDLTGNSLNSHNALTLRIEDVLDITDSTHSLFVDGNSSDSVQAIGNWAMSESLAVNDHVYNHYVGGSVDLYVDQNIQTAILA